MKPMYIPANHRALSHMKPRGSLEATVLTEGKTLPEGSADLEISHQANRRGILPSGRDLFFSDNNALEKGNFLSQKNLKRIWGCS